MPAEQGSGQFVAIRVNVSLFEGEWVLHVFELQSEVYGPVRYSKLADIKQQDKSMPIGEPTSKVYRLRATHEMRIEKDLVCDGEPTLDEFDEFDHDLEHFPETYECIGPPTNRSRQNAESPGQFRRYTILIILENNYTFQVLDPTRDRFAGRSEERLMPLDAYLQQHMPALSLHYNVKRFGFHNCKIELVCHCVHGFGDKPAWEAMMSLLTVDAWLPIISKCSDRIKELPEILTSSDAEWKRSTAKIFNELRTGLERHTKEPGGTEKFERLKNTGTGVLLSILSRDAGWKSGFRWRSHCTLKWTGRTWEKFCGW